MMKLVISLLAASVGLFAADPMPPAEQNAIVQKYCAVCHTDAVPHGGLSLQQFDAAHADPGVAAMIVSKLKGNALGASGQKVPDRATQDAFQSSIEAEAVGADRWTFHEAPILLASVVKQAGSTPNLYRLTVSCGEVQLAWSPDVPPQGREMSVSVDGGAAVVYKVSGKEAMGYGLTGTSGPGAAKLAVALPGQSLTVSNLFGDEKVVFPFSELDPKARRKLSACIAH